MMQRYLDNTGGRQQVDLDGMLSNMPEMQSFADQILIQPEVDRIVAQVQSNQRYNEPIPFRTDWKGYYLPPDKYPDWFRAVGGVDLSAGGLVTVSPPTTPGGPPQVHVTSQLNLADQTDAEAFGRILIPPGAQVLATTVDRGIDMRYQMTVHMQPDQVRQLLQESHFTEPLNPSDYGKQIAANAGPPMSTATSLRYAQDRIDTPEHGAVTREIFEDVRAEGVYVHIFAFTT